MTARQRIVPLLLIFTFSVGVTCYTFIPAYEKQKPELEARKKARQDLWATRYETPETSPSNDTTSPSELVRKTEERVANAGGATTISKDAPRWAEAQGGQWARYHNGFRWSEVPLDQYSERGGGQDGFGKKT